MSRKSKKGRKSKRLKPVVLVFGEDDNDRQAIAELVRALCPDVPAIKKRQSPLVLVKNRGNAEARKNALSAAEIVRADQKQHKVVAVIAHEDCDAVEPAHETVAARIAEHWGSMLPCPVIPATPAFEMEAWWFLWPDAVAKIVSTWHPLPKTPRNVGKINNAKEALRDALRPPVKKKPRDYTESDAPEIARHVRELEIVHNPVATSLSFETFAQKIVDTFCPRDA